MSGDKKQVAYQSEWRLQSVLGGEARTMELCGSTLTIPEERKFASVETIQRYVDTVLRLPNVRRRWPRVGRDVRVVGTKARPHAHYDPAVREIHVPTHGPVTSISWAMRETVILHEIAHHLEHDGHGPRWRGAFCYLLEDCVAPEAGFMMTVFMSEEGLQLAVPMVQ